MVTPAQKWRQQKFAEKAAKQAREAFAGGSIHGAPQGSEYQILLANLLEHKRILSTISSMSAKANHKAVAITEFDGWVDGVLNTNAGLQDEILATMLIWNADAGNYERMLQIGRYALKHQIKMPNQFNSTVAEFMMDTIVKDAPRGMLGTPDQTLFLIEEVLQATALEDTKDQPRAKLYKTHAQALIGKLGKSDFDVEQLSIAVTAHAIMDFRTATHLFEGVQVKKDTQKLESYLKKQAPELLEKLPATHGDSSWIELLDTLDTLDIKESSGEDSDSNTSLPDNEVPPAPQTAQDEDLGLAVQAATSQTSTDS